MKHIALSNCLTIAVLLYGFWYGACPLAAAPEPGRGTHINQADPIHRKTAAALFSNRMSSLYRVVVTRYAKADLQDISEVTTAGLTEIVSYRFKSKKPVQTGNNMYLQLHLRTYVYTSPARAEAAFATYDATQKKMAEEMRSKSPQLVLQSNDRIYILHGSCLFSQANWSAVEHQLSQAVEQSGGQIAAVLRKGCGGKPVHQ